MIKVKDNHEDVVITRPRPKATQARVPNEDLCDNTSLGEYLARAMGKFVERP